MGMRSVIWKVPCKICFLGVVPVTAPLHSLYSYTLSVDHMIRGVLFSNVDFLQSIDLIRFCRFVQLIVDAMMFR